MLLGRSAETAAISELLTAARGGQGGVLVVRGEAGVGKSALLNFAAKNAEDFTVLRGFGVDGDSELAYAALHQTLRPAIDRIDRLPAPQAGALKAALALSSETVNERFRVSLGVLGLLSEVAEEAPLLCLIDDAQWLDQASSDALLFAARRLEVEAVVVLFAARDDDDNPFVAHGVSELRLSGLTPSDSRQLLSEQLGTSVGAGVVEWLVMNSNGNPLALMELPRIMTPDQLAGQSSMADQLPRATSVEQVYLRRAKSLPAETQSLLLLAACEETGARATVQGAASELGLDIDDLAAAESAGLLRVDSEQLLFSHPLVRTAIYRAARFTERERAHRTLAVAAAAEGNADRAVWHLAAATVGTNEDVAHELEVTAERARRRSGHAAAASALERAAALSRDPDSRARRLVAAASAAWAAGQPERATALIDRASPDVSDLHVQTESDALRGVIEWRCGSLPDACATLIAGAAQMAPLDPSRALEMLADAAIASWDSGDYGRLAETAHAVAALPQAHDREHAVLADLLVGVVSLSQATNPRNLSPVVRAISQAHEFDEPRLLIWAAVGAELTGEHALEVALLDRAAALARSSGAVDLLTLVLEGRAVQGFLAGDFTATVEATEGLQLAIEAELPNAANLHRACLAWLAAAQGRDDECRAHAEAALAAARPHGQGIACSIAEWAVAQLDLGRGRPAETAIRLAQLATAEPGVRHPLYVLTSASDLIEAYIRTEQREAAQEAFEWLDAFARQDGPIWARAQAARCRALLAEGSSAEAEFAIALELHEESGNPYDRARTRLLYGEWLRRERRRTDAREQLRSALAAFETLRAEPWAERARAELRATGETAGKRDPSAVRHLTPQEFQIARLVGQGGSNKEVAAQLFLSRRTIEYHLSNVYTKLGIASRAELIRDGVSPALASVS